MHRAGFAIVLAGRCELLEAQTNRSDRNPPRRHDRRMILDSETKAVELPDDHWRVGMTKTLLGATLRWQGREEEAMGLMVEGVATIRAHLGPDAPETRRAEVLLASAPERS